jgi:hypothetical protein
MMGSRDCAGVGGPKALIGRPVPSDRVDRNASRVSFRQETIDVRLEAPAATLRSHQRAAASA